MEIEEIKNRFDMALQLFLTNESYLLKHDVSERAITHKLAEYLKVAFPRQDVDCEYNRNLKKPKMLQFRFNHALLSEVEKLIRRATEYATTLKLQASEYENIEAPLKGVSTYPDIIVHTRGENHPHNILIVEVKKHDAGIDDDLNFDYAKLEAFTSDDDLNPYQYLLGIHLILNCGDDAQTAPILKYFINGSLVG